MVATCPPELVQLLLLAIGAVLGLCSGLIAFYLKEVRRQVREEIGELSENLSRMQRDLSRLEAGLPEKYVLRDDWIRETAKVDQHLQKITAELCTVSKNVARLAAGSGGTDGLASA